MAKEFLVVTAVGRCVANWRISVRRSMGISMGISK
jgi:hypothetical protein